VQNAKIVVHIAHRTRHKGGKKLPTWKLFCRTLHCDLW